MHKKAVQNKRNYRSDELFPSSSLDGSFDDITTFERLNQQYVSLHKEYANSFNELNQNIESRTCKREFARGGEGLHRGARSPSMMDIVVGGVNRGKLLRKRPLNNLYNYEYLLDAQANLLCVYNYEYINGSIKLLSTELLIYQQNQTLSLVFDADETHSLSFISKCIYENDNLMRYETALFALPPERNACLEINVETYEYLNGQIQAFRWCRYNPFIKLLNQEKFTFARDDNGYLSTYKVERINGLKSRNELVDTGNVYTVHVKRR